jgi:hypothetical protein
MEINRPDTDFFVSVPRGLVTFARNNLVHDARQNMVLWCSFAIGRWLRCSGNLTRTPGARAYVVNSPPDLHLAVIPSPNSLYSRAPSLWGFSYNSHRPKYYYYFLSDSVLYRLYSVLGASE